MYRKTRLNAFVGLNLTPEMNEELEREAVRALRTKNEFIRYLIEEGLKSWRFSDLRALRKSP